jgi:hypothetical protein
MYAILSFFIMHSLDSAEPVFETTVTQLVKKSPAFYGTEMSISVHNNQSLEPVLSQLISITPFSNN